MLHDIPLQRIDQTILEALIGATEGKQLEFKEQLPKGDRDSTKEFLKDITALANTLGGDILYGVKEGRNENGDTVAEALSGLSDIDIDQEIRRLESVLLTSVQPRLYGYVLHPLVFADGKKFLLVRVPRSWNAPHVVDYQKHWRFYYRNSAGSHPRDVTELRHAYTFGTTVKQRLEEFRLDRLASIAVNPSLEGVGKLVIHLQPFDSVRDDFRVDLNKIPDPARDLILLRWDDIFPVIKPNFEGRLVKSHSDEKDYIQLFHNGAIEEVDTYVITVEREGINYIPSRDFERKLIRAIARRLMFLKNSEVPFPVLIHIWLLDVKGYRLGIQRGNSDSWSIEDYQRTADQNPIDRSDLLFQSIFVESIPTTVSSIDDHFTFVSQFLRPLLDSFWNSAGISRSHHYNSAGEWVPNFV